MSSFYIFETIKWNFVLMVILSKQLFKKIPIFHFRNDDDYDYSAREDAAESGLIRAKSPLQYYK